ncbi:MAG: sulfatase-like hydrolase/transferase [Luteitalea sp.]|nr:sulfatase-like hydrolase/transferase [Luteitalea sp.]
MRLLELLWKCDSVRGTIIACLGLLGLTACATAGIGQESEREVRRPNIILILADDMGYSDLGSYGSEIVTPNLDRLASEGLRFRQFYNTARCSPTRASLLMGRYPHEVGVGHLTEDFGHPSYQGYLSERGSTIPEALKSFGYRSYAVGKWHVGDERGHWPLDRGFDRFYGIPAGGGVYFWPPLLDRQLVLDASVITPPDGWYSTDAFNDQAVSFIREAHQAGQPFFLYLPHIAPHFPLQAPEHDIARYRERYREGWDVLRARRHRRLLEEGLIDDVWKLPPRDPEAPPWEEVKEKEKKQWVEKMAVYAATIDRMDQGIGRVLNVLDELSIAEHTMVLFLSDNGAEAGHVDRGRPGAPPGHPDSFMSYDLPWANLSNTPFRRFKTWVHEGGIASPLIVRWPEVISAGSITHEVGHVIDLMPTFLEVAGRSAKWHNSRQQVPLDGRSLLPVLQGGSRGAPQPLFWEHEGNRAVRDGRWKAVAARGGTWELYDLQRDPTEMVDLAAQHPERVRQLTHRYEGWAARVGVLPWEEVQRLRRARQ